jgi:hypothetical protein
MKQHKNHINILSILEYMTNYTCERCHYTTHLRSDYKKHLQKQTSCPSTFSNKDPSVILEGLAHPKAFHCAHCEKSFGYPQSLARHEKNVHQNITITHTDSNHHNITENHSNSHNMTNCHNTVNLHLNVFGKEELGHILNDEEFLTECVRNVSGQGLQNIVRSIWCNKNIPENHNVELKRERKPRLVNVFVDDAVSGKGWVEKLADEVIDDMIRKGTGILQVQNNKLYKFDEEMTESDTERYDIRSTAISKLMKKSRGYGKKRDSIVVELRNLKNA